MCAAITDYVFFSGKIPARWSGPPSSLCDTLYCHQSLVRSFNLNMASSSKQPKRAVLPAYLDLYGIIEHSGACICVVCQKTIANESIKPNKLERHMKTHPKFACLDKDARKRAFRKSSEQYLKSVSFLTGSLSENDKIAMFVYKTAFLSAQNKRPFVEGEALIKPCLMNFVDIFADQPYGKKLKSIAGSMPMSDNTMQEDGGVCC